MTLNRNDFLESLVKASEKLNILFLNHSGSPATLLTDLVSIEVMANKTHTREFKNYILSHPLVSELVVTPEFRRTKMVISFRDGSQLNFLVIRQIVIRSLCCFNLADIKASSFINDYGMLSPSVFHHFEYLLIKYQFAEREFPDKFQKYFSALDIVSRTAIFRHIQPKFNLVFNTIEDLYKPKGGVQLKLVVGLRKLKVNTLLRMFIRSVNQVLWIFFHLFYKKDYRYSALPSGDKNESGPLSKRTAGHAVL